MLAPSLRYVADSLALSWRHQLTAAAHARYLKHNNFYTVSQLAGMQACADMSRSVMIGIHSTPK